MRKDKKLVLSTLKTNTLKDFILTSPEMISSSFKKDTLIQSCVSAEIIDSKTKSCLDIYGIIDGFKVNWINVKGEK